MVTQRAIQNLKSMGHIIRPDILLGQCRSRRRAYCAMLKPMPATPPPSISNWLRRNLPFVCGVARLFQNRFIAARLLVLLWTVFSMLACLYPPWTAHMPANRGGRSLFLGYAPIWSSPTAGDDSFRRLVVTFAAVDFSRLALEIIAAGLAFASLYLALGIREQLGRTETKKAESPTSAR